MVLSVTDRNVPLAHLRVPGSVISGETMAPPLWGVSSGVYAHRSTAVEVITISRRRQPRSMQWSMRTQMLMMGRREEMPYQMYVLDKKVGLRF